jgi:hypothetical protein
VVEGHPTMEKVAMEEKMDCQEEEDIHQPGDPQEEDHPVQHQMQDTEHMPQR